MLAFVPFLTSLRPRSSPSAFPTSYTQFWRKRHIYCTWYRTQHYVHVARLTRSVLRADEPLPLPVAKVPDLELTIPPADVLDSTRVRPPPRPRRYVLADNSDAWRSSPDYTITLLRTSSAEPRVSRASSRACHTEWIPVRLLGTRLPMTGPRDDWMPTSLAGCQALVQSRPSRGLLRHFFEFFAT
ncbi:hypothetical protein EXIGLDRAFT_769714 [Exidia glandulosa HHB12029]|uniref:Uncharacterized protein n=1 Tax=Exidia glandulosa HHB12029 TaxID=1314781 RepID=A0A165HAD1_EXIGL|nr:hypothetical protein EXIGLDRAFT_769714 [Exidia glandulosa HHB12029]